MLGGKGFQTFAGSISPPHKDFMICTVTKTMRLVYTRQLIAALKKSMTLMIN